MSSYQRLSVGIESNEGRSMNEITKPRHYTQGPIECLEAIDSMLTGDSEATAWGCELTEEYVVFNSAYTT